LPSPLELWQLFLVVSTGGLAPLVFMLIAGIMVRSSLHSVFGGNDAGSLGQQMRDQAMSAVSVGLGAYLSILVSIYFAGVGTKQFLAAKGSDGLMLEKTRKNAA